MSETDVWLKQVWREFLVALTSSYSKCILELLWMWVLFDDGKDALKKLKQEEQHFKRNCTVVTLALHWCRITPARQITVAWWLLYNNIWIMFHTINQQRKHNGNNWRAWLFQGLCLFSVMNADRRIQRHEDSIHHWPFAPTRRECFPPPDCHLGPPFGTRIQDVFDRKATNNIPKEE
jgi:hypothetical protein